MKKSKRMLRKFLLLTSSALLLVSLTVGVTLAYLTDTESVTNTFTVGKVGIDLTETVDEGLTANDEGGYIYHLLPGQTYTKKPVITVDAGSEDAWIVAKVVVTASDMAKVRELVGYGDDKSMLGFHDILSGGVFEDTYTVNGNVWTGSNATLKQVANANDNTFYVFFKDAQAANASVTLFETIKARDVWNNDDIAKLAGLKMQITAYGIQKEGFNSAEEAFEAAFPNE